eukprot:TRINITY_DN12670_c0_g1_i1.p1 TRINITY_DN12670_c0_g1~~TRINITY_DN12670_c0_g1_i1.p1  ORF type:complete len:917 (+),score=96.84 TRINITY_DN12670_c0_g1_i1:242-2752(+)
MCVLKFVPLLISLLVSVVLCGDIAVECVAAVHSVFAGCPTLIGLLNLTELDNGITDSIITDISTVLDSSCCDGLQILQAERCLCDDGFVSLLKSGKTIDEFTMGLLTESIFFECDIVVDYGSDCFNSSPLIYSNLSLHQQNHSNASNFDYSATVNTLPAPLVALPNLRLEHISNQIQLPDNVTQQPLLDLPEFEQLNNRVDGLSNNSSIKQIQQQQQIGNFNSQSQINGTLRRHQQILQDINIQNYLGINFNGAISKVDYHVDSASRQFEAPVNNEEGIVENVGQSVYAQQIYLQDNDTQIDSVTQFYNQFIYPQVNNPDVVHKLKDVSAVINSRSDNSTKNSVNNQQNFTHSAWFTDNHMNNDIFNTTHAQLDVAQLSVSVAPHKNLSTSSMNGDYMDDASLSNDDGGVGIVLKSIDREVGQLQKLPKYLPAVEQTAADFSYNNDTAQYIAWAVDEQQAELQAYTHEHEPLAEADDDAWQFRQANKVCENGVIMEMDSYKQASIIGQCLRQSRNALQAQDFIVAIAPQNPGILHWLKNDVNISLVQFLSDAIKVQDVVGRHIAVGQPINLKSMANGQAITLKAMQGSFISISKQGQQFFANDILVQSVRYTCDGVILMIANPLGPPYGLMYNKEEEEEAGSSISMEPHYKQTSDESMMPYEGCQHANVFELLKDAYPGFAYLASQQGMEDFLRNSRNDVTVFVPGTLGEGIQIEDYIMVNKLLSKDISWLGTGTTLSMNSGMQQIIDISETGKVLIGGSHIVAWDNVGCNGVMHVLDNQFQNRSSSLAAPPPPPPEAPMTIDIGDGMSLISVDHQQTYLSNQEIYQLVVNMMSSP